MRERANGCIIQMPGAKLLLTNHSPLFAPVPEPSIKTAVEAMSMSMMVMIAMQRNQAAGQ